MPSGNLSGAYTYSSVFFSGDTVLCDVELYHTLSVLFSHPVDWVTLTIKCLFSFKTVRGHSAYPLVSH